MTRPEAGAPYASWVFLALVAITPLTAYLWTYGFAAFPPIAAILLIPVFRAGRPSEVWTALLLLLLYAMAATVWSPVFAAHGPVEGYADAESQTWGKLAMNLGLYAVLVVTAARLPVATMRRLGLVFMIGATALGAVLLLEGLWGTRLYNLLLQATGDDLRPDLQRRNVAQATYTLALMYWPVLTMLTRRGWKRPALVVAVAGVGAPILLHAWAPVAALAVGGVVFWLSKRLGERAGTVLGAGAAGIVILAPWVVLASAGPFDWAGERLGASWAARLDIWSFTAEQTLAHPLFGWGLDGSRAFLPFMLHPHSAPLQIWLELGLVGAVLFAGVWFFVSRAAGRIGPQGLAAAASYFVIGALSFGVWQEWWLGLAAMTAIWVMLSDARLAPKIDTMIEA
jgi:O-antigen ligase